MMLLYIGYNKMNNQNPYAKGGPNSTEHLGTDYSNNYNYPQPNETPYNMLNA